MKTILQIIACLALFPFTLSAQHFSNSYLSFDYSSEWSVKTKNQANVEGVYFYDNQDESSFNNYGMILVLKQSISPRAVISAYIAQKGSNPMLRNATFSSIQESVFLGYKTQSVSFTTTEDGKTFTGAMHAFNEADYTVYIASEYNTALGSKLTQIWNKIVWERSHTPIVVQSSSTGSVYTQIKNLVQTTNANIASMSPVSGVQVLPISMYENNEKGLIFKYKITSARKIDYSNSVLEKQKATLRKETAATLKAQSNIDEMTRLAREGQFKMKYIYYDKDMVELFRFTIMPNEYCD